MEFVVFIRPRRGEIGVKALRIKLPIVLEIVDADKMKKSVSAETHLIIAIPLENVEVSDGDDE